MRIGKIDLLKMIEKVMEKELMPPKDLHGDRADAYRDAVKKAISIVKRHHVIYKN